MEYRFYKNSPSSQQLDLKKSFVMVDNIDLKKPMSFPLSMVGEKLQMHLD